MSSKQKTVLEFPKARDRIDQKRRLSELMKMPIPKGANKCLKGLTFAITGTLPALSRAQAKKLIEKYGGKVASSVGPKVDIVIQGYDEEGSTKIQQAEERGIPISDQEGLFKFIADSNPNKKLINKNIQKYLLLQNISKIGKICKPKFSLILMIRATLKKIINHYYK